MSTEHYEAPGISGRRIWRSLGIGGLLFALSGAPPAQASNPTVNAAMTPTETEATILLKKTLDDLVAEADAIVVGTVAETQSLYAADRDIYTLVTLTDLQVLNGSLGDASLTIQLIGGRIGGDILEVDGSPKLARNERVLLFVKGNGREMVPIVGWSQGVFRLEQNGAGGSARVKDHERNPVLAVRGNDVVRQQLRLPDATIVPDLGRRGPSGSAGESDDDYVFPDDLLRDMRDPAEAMDADAFLSDIVRKVKEKGITGKRIESADAERLSNTPARRALPPPPQ